MFTERESETLSVYERLGREEEIESVPIWADRLTIGTYAQLPTNAIVVDIGCGHGRFVDILPDLRICSSAYVGIDPAESQIRLARKLHPHHSFEIGDIYELGKKHPKRFGGFICTAVLMHLPRERLKEGLASLRARLWDNAMGYI